jgi:DNA-binding MarR family transcriptional regulator
MRATNKLPLPALLSQLLVAFTIEFDNEFERQMPHRTTDHGATTGSRSGPWLVSLVMWSNCMQFVGDQGVRLRELEQLAGTKTNLNGMERWGYVVVEPDSTTGPRKAPRSEWMIRATPKGRKAQEVWRPLFGAIEKRWETRFGATEINELRESLRTLDDRLDLDLPDCLPILGYGLVSKPPTFTPRSSAARENDAVVRRPLSALLSRVLLAFTLEFESESDLSLAISANVLRVLDEKGIRVRDLPALTGVSKEALKMALGFLQTKRMIVIQPDPVAGRMKIVRLTSKGRDAQGAYWRLLGTIEERWLSRFGSDVIRRLRESLEQIVGEPIADLLPLFSGLKPYPEGWRASVPKPATLPHFPMVLHRGGFPDGS